MLYAGERVRPGRGQLLLVDRKGEQIIDERTDREGLPGPISPIALGTGKKIRDGERLSISSPPTDWAQAQARLEGLQRALQELHDGGHFVTNHWLSCCPTARAPRRWPTR